MKQCNAVLDDKTLCRATTVITLGAAKLCRHHQRRLSEEKVVKVFRNGREKIVKTHV